MDRFKQNNTDKLNLSTSWHTVPGTGDVAVWDSTVIGANYVNLGANPSWGGLRIAAPGGGVSIGGANHLTIGSSGLDTDSIRNLNLTNTGQTTAVTVSGTLADSTALTLNSNTTRNWSGMTVVNFTGASLTNCGDFRSGWGSTGNRTISVNSANNHDFQGGSCKTITAPVAFISKNPRRIQILTYENAYQDTIVCAGKLAARDLLSAGGP